MQTRDASVQLLTFKLDEQDYALDTSNVVQVIRMVTLTRPPKAPDYVEGMFNLRGNVISAIDTRKRCGLPPKAHDLNTQLLIARANERTVALTVDLVSEVLTLSENDVQPADEVSNGMRFLRGVAKVGERLILIIDPVSISSEEVVVSSNGNGHGVIASNGNGHGVIA
jgi:purine-binding chemotaxis protein CheW